MKSPAAFTLLELVVSVSVTLVLAALLLGAVTRVRSESAATACVSNLRQWGIAVQLYANDNGGYLPRRGQGVQPVWVINRTEDWFNALPPYLGVAQFQSLVQNGRAPQPGDKSIFVCPSATTMGLAGQYFLCYGMNMFLSRWDEANETKEVQLPNPEFMAFMADSPGGYASTMPSTAQFSVQPRHNGYANVAFLDGHVQAFTGTYLGCGANEIEQPDVHWKTGIPGDTWVPIQ